MRAHSATFGLALWGSFFLVADCIKLSRDTTQEVPTTYLTTKSVALDKWRVSLSARTSVIDVDVHCGHRSISIDGHGSTFTRWQLESIETLLATLGDYNTSASACDRQNVVWSITAFLARAPVGSNFSTQPGGKVLRSGAGENPLIAPPHEPIKCLDDWSYAVARFTNLTDEFNLTLQVGMPLDSYWVKVFHAGDCVPDKKGTELRLTQDCFNYDACRGTSTPALFEQAFCYDEWLETADDFMFGSPCDFALSDRPTETSSTTTTATTTTLA